MTYSAKVISGGKIVIPAELRRALGIETGDSLVIACEDGKLIIRTYDQVVKEVQSWVRASLPDDGRSLVDELIADRRAEAAREDADLAAWLAARDS